MQQEPWLHFMYYALYKQLTGKAKSQQGCLDNFGCKMTPLKGLVTGKKQPGEPGKGKGAGKSSKVNSSNMTGKVGFQGE